VRITILCAYIGLSITVTPFIEHYFTTFTLTSIFFAVELLGTTIKYTDGLDAQIGLPFFVIIAVQSGLMFLVTYSLRSLLTEFFVIKTGAEKTRDALTQTLDNLPDAVLMFEQDDLTYCN
jgi:hypothetical protein